jgi:hypothetical protein
MVPYDEGSERHEHGSQLSGDGEGDGSTPPDTDRLSEIVNSMRAPGGSGGGDGGGGDGGGLSGGGLGVGAAGGGGDGAKIRLPTTASLDLSRITTRSAFDSEFRGAVAREYSNSSYAAGTSLISTLTW